MAPFHDLAGRDGPALSCDQRVDGGILELATSRTARAFSSVSTSVDGFVANLPQVAASFGR